ncbi:MAG: HAMP domain-containing histidine kinase [Paludibacteraceae bacterium]|nr:HAMP domain-containing histidine kinase [Paludibacteraceae bacterium]
MKKKRKKSLQSFLITLFLGTMFLLWALDSIAEFFKGFTQALVGDGSETLPQDERMDVALLIARILSIVFVCIIFWMIKKKVSDPVKRLSQSMARVREGDLDADMEVLDSFEFGQMEKDFNSMVVGLRDARDLREQNAEANRKLYAEIAHDLKTPMTMILGYAKLLSKGEVTEETRKEYLSTIVEQTENANALLEQMLEYAKLGSTEYRLDIKEGDLAECLRQVAAESYYRFEEKKMDLEVEIPKDAVLCHYDERQMNRVFFNLIGNVISHNPEGTAVKIVMELSEAASKEAEGGTPGTVEIRVADNGPLIPKELKEHLFEPFHAGEDSRNSRGGSGLGLSVAKKIAQLHGGDLEYREELTEGFKGFVLTVPGK